MSLDPDFAAIDGGESAGSGASTPTTPDPQSPLIKTGNNRFNVQFVEVPEQRPSVGTDPDTSRQDNSGSHTHNDTHRSQSTFHYQVFDTLDFGPKTAFYRRDTQEGGTARPTMEELRRGTREKKEKVDTPKIITETSGSLKLGWIQGVLMRCLLNIWGVMLFIRISWVIGQAGIGAGIGIIMLSAVVTSLTTVSLAAICTNGEVKGGGAYYLISRSLGPEFGGAIGIIFSIANAIAVAMYVVGFAETLVQLLRDDNDIKITSSAVNDMRILGCCTLVLLFGVSMMGMAWESKAQFILLILLVIAMVNFVVGTFINNEGKEGKGFFGYNVEIAKYNMVPHYTEGQNFFTVFSVFFPAATGIMAGANISGDLADPSQAIPKGTLVAILMSTITYVIFAAQAGATTILSAPGNVSFYQGYTPLANMSYDMSCPWMQSEDPTDDVVPCPWGLRQNYQTMAMISAWPPLITIGIFAATLSSALASLVSAPKVFQAVCKDKLFPYIGWFAKGYGSNNEPWRGYVLTFFIAAAFICIAELNAIAPIITNFFLVSYALINYSCFEASMSNSPGWRPSFKYYNMWTSLAGAILCAVVMFVVSWWTALITCCIIVILYRYIDYKKPDVNWGSSKQALKYNRALQLILELGKLQYHVKNFRPQFLVLTGSPSSRPRLTSFISQVSKGNGVFMCGQVVHNKHRLDLPHFNEAQWLISNKLKGFHMAVSAWTFREGVEKMLQQNGLGELSANTLIMGYKHNWMEQPVNAVEEYVNIIVDAFDHKYGVGILRAKDGFDVKNLPHDDVQTFSEEINLDDMRAGVNSATVSTAELAREAEDVMSDGEEKEVHAVNNIQSDDNGIEMEEIQEKRDEENPSPSSVSNIDQYRGFGAEKPKGTIDVYWLSDDGGLSILLPYLLSQSPYWTSTKMRVFFSGKNKREMGYDKARMAALLSKFRIEFSSVEIVDGLSSPPIDSSVDAYVKFFPSEEFDEGGRPVLDAKTLQYIRIGELLRENSKLASNTELIVVTMPVPRHNTPPLQYMSWLETISSDLPPLLLLRGNQSDALTFYC